jgi:hypothetical protein
VLKPKHPEAQRYSKLSKNPRSFKDLQSSISALPTEKERGDAFEVFAEAHLATNPIFQVKRIWPEMVIPPSMRKRLSLPQKDKGIDGVFETHGGGISMAQSILGTNFRLNLPT